MRWCCWLSYLSSDSPYNQESHFIGVIVASFIFGVMTAVFSVWTCRYRSLESSIRKSLDRIVHTEQGASSDLTRSNRALRRCREESGRRCCRHVGRARTKAYLHEGNGSQHRLEGARANRIFLAKSAQKSDSAESPGSAQCGGSFAADAKSCGSCGDRM